VARYAPVGGDLPAGARADLSYKGNAPHPRGAIRRV
jgi:hypothetical protein